MVYAACSANVLQFIPRFWKESIIVFAVFSQMDCSLDSAKIIKTLLMQKLGVKLTRLNLEEPRQAGHKACRKSS